MPIPEDPQDRFNYFADAFLGCCEGMQATADDLLMQARDILAIGETTNGEIAEVRAGTVLRQLEKQVQRLMYNLDQMHNSIGLEQPFGSAP
jgi:hypothetical protein